MKFSPGKESRVLNTLSVLHKSWNTMRQIMQNNNCSLASSGYQTKYFLSVPEILFKAFLVLMPPNSSTSRQAHIYTSKWHHKTTHTYRHFEHSFILPQQKSKYTAIFCYPWSIKTGEICWHINYLILH